MQTENDGKLELTQVLLYLKRTENNFSDINSYCNYYL